MESGGMVNSNVLHMTKAISQREKNIQLLHIFDVSLLAGEQGSRIEQKYIAPVITAPQMEVIPLFPGNAEEERILKLIAASFRLSSDEFGYEIKLRETLTEIWLMLFELSRPMREKKGEHNKSNDKIKLMMIYIHEHYREKISIPELAAAAYLSERECYRVFHDCCWFVGIGERIFPQLCRQAWTGSRVFGNPGVSRPVLPIRGLRFSPQKRRI